MLHPAGGRQATIELHHEGGTDGGKTLITLEGLPEERRQQIAESFSSCGGVQCGFCIPGMAMRGHALVEQNSSPTREEIAQ